MSPRRGTAPREPGPGESPFGLYLESFARLRAAGILENFDYDSATDTGRVILSPAFLRLLESGRHPMTESTFVDAFESGDVRAVRAWIEREANKLDDRS